MVDEWCLCMYVSIKVLKFKIFMVVKNVDIKVFYIGFRILFFYIVKYV